MNENINGEKGIKENRIRAITKIYYSNPSVINALVEFAQKRETIPRYYEGFGKRPDTIQYPSDIIELVKKGATSFHCSEELWNDPLAINNDLTKEQFNDLRRGWDLLIDIDSPYLDLSKIAAILVIRALEFHGVNNYGIKFSGSKGFHIIVSWNAFPQKFNDIQTKNMFPDWPRTITEYLFSWIEPKFIEEAGKIMTFKKPDSKEEMFCSNCNKPSSIGKLIIYKCDVCGLVAERKNPQIKKKLKCMNPGCAGVLEVDKEEDFHYCENCKDFENANLKLDSVRHPDNFKIKKGENVSEHAKFDLVLVAPRHLFRMPYSLHEKTSLSSIVLNKSEIENFQPRDANAFNIKIKDFYPKNKENEAARLLKEALNWKKEKDKEKEESEKNYYSNYNVQKDNKKQEYEEIKPEDVKDEMFPDSIKKLLMGLRDGRKRGLFILITFFRNLNFSPEEINNRIKNWNLKNEVPLKEGYIKSQIDWHLKQKRKILPPNYENEAFYKDLGLINEKPEVKNPLVELGRNLRKDKTR